MNTGLPTGSSRSAPRCRLPQTYYEHKVRQANPAWLPPRVQRDIDLSREIRRVYEENFQVYDARKGWRQLGREGIVVARCTVERLMPAMGLEGGRGKKCRTTVGDASLEQPATRPNQLWVADFTYVATWLGCVYTAFVVDVFTRRIVWRVARS